MATVLGSTGPNNLVGTGVGDTILAFGGQDTVDAGAGDDFIVMSIGGSDTIDGGADHDTVVLSGSLADYEISTDGTSITFASGGVTEKMTSVEAVVFDDALQNVHYVDDDGGPGVHTSIQDAIAAAAAGDIIVAPRASTTRMSLSIRR